jgi:hypothetical protein
MASHSDMQNTRIIAFLKKEDNSCSFKWKKYTNACFRLHVYLHTNKKQIHNSLHVFDKWGKLKP